jgi:glycosyltransferase involved in cell wall biosynthesis
MFDGITIVTPMMKEEICRVYGLRSDWVGTLPNGISNDYLEYRQRECGARSLREKLGLSDKFVIIYHGSFRPNGGLLESIEAIRLIRNKYPDIVLFLLGSASPKFLEVLEGAIEINNLQNNVILHEPVDFHNVPDYISMSDVGFVPLPNIPAWRHQQPLKLLEYMAMNKTTIATDIPANSYIAGRSSCVIYVPSSNSNELATAMVFAYQNRDKLKEWGEAGQRVVKEKYVWKKVNNDLISYLTGI